MTLNTLFSISASKAVEIRVLTEEDKRKRGPGKETVGDSLGRELAKNYLKDPSLIKAWESLNYNKDLAQRESKGYQKEMIQF